MAQNPSGKEKGRKHPPCLSSKGSLVRTRLLTRAQEPRIHCGSPGDILVLHDTPTTHTDRADRCPARAEGHATRKGHDPIFSVGGLQAEERPPGLHQGLQLQRVDADWIGVVIAERRRRKRFGLGDVDAAYPGPIHPAEALQSAAPIDDRDVHRNADHIGSNGGEGKHVDHLQKINIIGRRRIRREPAEHHRQSANGKPRCHHPHKLFHLRFPLCLWGPQRPQLCMMQ